MSAKSVATIVLLGLALTVSPAFGDTPAATFSNLTGQQLGNGPYTLAGLYKLLVSFGVSHSCRTVCRLC